MFFRRNTQTSAQSSVAPSSSGASASSGAPTAPPPPLKTLADLERELEAEQQAAAQLARSSQAPLTRRHQRRGVSRLLWLALLVGIPVTALWVINVPNSPIRRVVAAHAPMLLLPSYLAMEQSFREAIAHLEQARQFIDQATSYNDIVMGAEHLTQAQASLDAMPLDRLDYDWRNPYQYYDWRWNWRLTYRSMMTARQETARLQAKATQEQQAFTRLEEAEESLNLARQQYTQAQSSTEQQAAIVDWQVAIDAIAQIPPHTFAGQTARTRLNAYQRDFNAVGGLNAFSGKAATFIAAAKQFGWRAAKMGQNPPHTEATWKAIAHMWEQAIQELAQVPASESQGYLEAQRLTAEYQSNLSVVSMRRQEEIEAVQALATANRSIDALLASIPADGPINRQVTITQLQRIIEQLKVIKPGTTAYAEAQLLIQQAQNKLNQF